jgi:dolichol-phosphate mannosyltransferase
LLTSAPERRPLITIVLPAYNEAEALPPLLAAMGKLNTRLPETRVFVIDDGSSDRTADVVREQAKGNDWLRLVEHPHNMGLSQAIQTGFQTALDGSAPTDVIVTMDADNTHDPAQIESMVALLDEGCDVVIASRYRRGAETYGIPPHRQLFSLGVRLLFRLMLPIRGVRDYSCGYRAYRAGVLQHAIDRWGEDFITEDGFACMAEILFRLQQLAPPVRFGEIPLRLHYDQKPGPTKMPVWRTITDTLKMGMRYRLGREKR